MNEGRVLEVRRRMLTVLAAVLLVLGAGAGSVPARSADTSGVAFSASIDGRPVAGADANHPILLRSTRPMTIEVTVENRSTSEVFIRSIRVDSRIIGLTFFAYETRVDMRLPPGTTDDRHYALELVDVERQVIGLLPARLSLLDEGRRTLAVRQFSTEVDGSLRSVYGVSGMLIAIMTALLLGSVVVRLATHKLSPNRWKRGTRFATAGLGLGLTLTFTLSSQGVLLPSPNHSINVVLVCVGVSFIMGYATPAFDDDESSDTDESVADGGRVAADQ